MRLTMAWKDIASGACFDRPPITEGGASPGASLFVPFTRRSRRIEDHRRCDWRGTWARRACSIGNDPEAAARGRQLSALVRGPFQEYRRSHRLLARQLRRAAQEEPAIQRLLLRFDAAAGSHRSRGRQSDDFEIADRAASGRRPALGVGKDAATTAAAATAPAPTFGTTPRRFRICSPRSSERCGRRNSGRRRTTKAIRRSARRCPSASSSTISTPRPTASWAAS